MATADGSAADAYAWAGDAFGEEAEVGITFGIHSELGTASGGPRRGIISAVVGSVSDVMESVHSGVKAAEGLTCDSGSACVLTT